MKTFHCIEFENILLINRGCSFEIKGVFVRINELVLQNPHESPKIKHLPLSDKRNQTQPIKRKQKPLTELYKKRKNYCQLLDVNMRKGEGQMKVLNLEQRDLQPNLSTQRQKIANELAECREKRLFNQCQYQKEKK